MLRGDSGGRLFGRNDAWEAVDGRGRNALANAVAAGHEAAVRFLLRLCGRQGQLPGAIVATDGAGLSAIHLACSNGRLPILRLLREPPAGGSSAAAAPKPTEAAFAVADLMGCAPLAYAYLRGHKDVVRQMLAWGVPPLSDAERAEHLAAGRVTAGSRGDPLGGTSLHALGGSRASGGGTHTHTHVAVPPNRADRQGGTAGGDYGGVEGLLERRTCTMCGVVVPKLLRCGGCHSAEAGYCGKACQKQHWKEGHKAECKKLREAHEKEQQQRRYLIPGKKLVNAPASD